MTKLKPPPPKLRLRLNERMTALANKSNDPLVKQLKAMLREFEYSDILPKRYQWKYLPDDVFTAIVEVSLDAEMINKTMLSHLVRIIEAFELTAVWRSTDLILCCIECLNSERYISASSLARSLVELAVHYGQAANALREYFDKFSWHHIRDAILILDQKNDQGKKVGLESYVERLMSGTKLKSHTSIVPDIEQRNILTEIDNLDKVLVRKNVGYQVRPHYELLCEVTHPNMLGFGRYLVSSQDEADGWQTRVMDKKAFGWPAEQICEEVLWALSFGAGSINGCFGVFQELMKKIGSHLGRPLPH